MRILQKIIGLVLLICGVYFLGQNIIFTTQTSPYWWRDISATATAILVVSGTVVLTVFKRIRPWGWPLVILGILLEFTSGGIVVRPTSLWTFFLSFLCLTWGFQLFRTKRIRF